MPADSVQNPVGLTRAGRAAAVRARLDEWVRRRRVPGLQYVAVDRAGVLLEHAAGAADLAAGEPMRGDTTLMAYSMSKTFTAIAVLQLAATGRLGLDDPAERWIAGFPYGPSVTLADLVAHTGGIANPLPLRWVHPVAAHASFDERAALADVLRRHPRLASPAGARFRYSNLGYWLLAPAVERASGLPFARYVQERVLAPLGIRFGEGFGEGSEAGTAELGYELPAGTGRHAEGYLEAFSAFNVLKRLLIDRTLIGRYSGRFLRIAPHYANGPAFGGLVGTARGVARLLEDQLRDTSAVLPPAARDWLYAPRTTRAGEPVPMTLGWHTRTALGRRVFFKEGGGGGFHCMMRLYRGPAAPATAGVATGPGDSARGSMHCDDGLGTVLMTNATLFDVGRALDDLDALWLAGG